MSFSSRKGFVSEINVTPFVDVMLVLLIIFMVAAPLMTEGLEVQLPKTQAVDTLPSDDNVVVLTVKEDGSLFFNDVRTSVDTLDMQLEAGVKSLNKQLFLKADTLVPYGVVVEIMGRIRAAGIEEIGIVAERIESAPSVPDTGKQSQRRGR